MDSPLVLVDGSSYLYRAFHALPPLNTSQGEPTGAIYGVVAMLRKLQKEVHPSTLAVVFDSPTPTFRHQLYPAYKANRLQMPEELQKQVPILHAVIRAMGLPLIHMAGVEADDIIGTLSKQAQAGGQPVLISTSDKDFAQLVNTNVHLVNTMTGVRLDPAGVMNRFGVKPCQIIDYLTLIGDTSDNVPGVPMVGPKTAVKWLTQYETLAQLLDNADAITGKVGVNLRQHREYLVLARQLITIQQDVNLNCSIGELKPISPDFNALREWFEKLEFKTWLKELDAQTADSKSADGVQRNFRDYELITDQVTFAKWQQAIQAAEWVAIDLETTSLDTLTAELVGIALAIQPNQCAYIPLQHDSMGTPPQLNLNWVLKQLKSWLEDASAKKIGHNLKYDRGILANYDIELAGIYADTLLEAYLLGSAYKSYDLDNLAERYLNYNVIRFEDIAGKGKQQLQFNQVPVEQAAPYAAEDVAVCHALHALLEPQLKENSSLLVRDQLEIPLITILSRMERHGVLINTPLLKQQSDELAVRLKVLEEKSYIVAGQPFNLGSPKQLQDILYRVHQLPILSKTTTGQPSTAESVLQALAVEHQLPQLILEYRTLSKLKSTYTDALPKQIHPKTGRIHTAYHQAVVTTGRLSSSGPNLQNIPIRTEEGRKIRRAFIAPSGYKLISADYSQIELRIMAHFSQDEALLQAFHNKLDVHAATAVELFGVALNQVTSEQRRQAKVVNFGLIYGISAFGLAAQLNTTSEAAKAIIDHYFNRYPGVKCYMEQTRQFAHQQGYVQTLLGRRLSLPLIHSSNKMHQKATERAAINAPLQGTAADIIKQAMINIETALQQSSIDAHMIMQVHDELIFEAKEEALDDALSLIERSMTQAASLAIPLEVTMGVGDNWEEAH